MRVYLADLGHNQLTFRSDIYPIGAANLAAYTQAYIKSPKPVELKPFREPQDLRAAIDSAPPTYSRFRVTHGITSFRSRSRAMASGGTRTSSQ